MPTTSLPHDGSLARLGIEELEERIEYAPLYASGDDTLPEPGTGCCNSFCNCTVRVPDILSGRPTVD